MRRHVVGAFIGVGQVTHAGVGGWRHEPVEEGLKVRLDLGISIFLNDERAGRVTHEKME